jgi:hypothetical protein
VRDKVAQAVGVVRGVRAILISILHNGSRRNLRQLQRGVHNVTDRTKQ